MDVESASLGVLESWRGGGILSSFISIATMATMASTPQQTSLVHDDLELDEASAREPSEGVSHAYPEGGREAWMCLFGSALMMFPSFGFQAASKSATLYNLYVVSLL